MSNSDTTRMALIGVTCLVMGWVLRSAFLPRRREDKDHGQSDDIDNSLPEEASETSSCASIGDCKLVLVVRMDLKMGKGKIAAQMLEEWLYGGQPKVVVKAPDEQALLTLMEAARALGVGMLEKG